MLEVVANVKIPEEFKTVEDGEERYNMCKAFEDMRLEGYEAGIADGIEKLIKSAKNFGVSKLAACEQLILQYELKENEAQEKIEMYWAD